MLNKKIKNNIKSEKGITLIALVITIIVLLILARNFDFNAESEIIRFLTKQDKQEMKQEKKVLQKEYKLHI